jgi:hypothetical protein
MRSGETSCASAADTNIGGASPAACTSATQSVVALTNVVRRRLALVGTAAAADAVAGLATAAALPPPPPLPLPAESRCSATTRKLAAVASAPSSPTHANIVTDETKATQRRSASGDTQKARQPALPGIAKPPRARAVSACTVSAPSARGGNGVDGVVRCGRVTRGSERGRPELARVWEPRVAGGAPLRTREAQQRAPARYGEERARGLAVAREARDRLDDAVRGSRRGERIFARLVCAERAVLARDE